MREYDPSPDPGRVAPERTAIAAATGIALAESAAAGSFAALRIRAGSGGTLVSANGRHSPLGSIVVLLKALVH